MPDPSRGVPETMDGPSILLDQARGVLDRRGSARPLHPSSEDKKIKESIGEFSARREILRTRNDIRRVIASPRRANGDKIFDLLFELKNGGFIVPEAKYDQSKMSESWHSAQKIKMDDSGTRGVVETTRVRVRQLETGWGEARLDELETMGRDEIDLARRMREARKQGTLETVAITSIADENASDVRVRRLVWTKRAWRDDATRAIETRRAKSPKGKAVRRKGGLVAAPVDTPTPLSADVAAAKPERDITRLRYTVLSRSTASTGSSTEEPSITVRQATGGGKASSARPRVNLLPQVKALTSRLRSSSLVRSGGAFIVSLLLERYVTGPLWARLEQKMAERALRKLEPEIDRAIAGMVPSLEEMQSDTGRPCLFAVVTVDLVRTTHTIAYLDEARETAPSYVATLRRATRSTKIRHGSRQFSDPVAVGLAPEKRAHDETTYAVPLVGPSEYYVLDLHRICQALDALQLALASSGEQHAALLDSLSSLQRCLSEAHVHFEAGSLVATRTSIRDFSERVSTLRNVLERGGTRGVAPPLQWIATRQVCMLEGATNRLLTRLERETHLRCAHAAVHTWPTQWRSEVRKHRNPEND